MPVEPVQLGAVAESLLAGFGVMADSGGASRGEMQGWVTKQWVYGELRGAA